MPHIKCEECETIHLVTDSEFLSEFNKENPVQEQIQWTCPECHRKQFLLSKNYLKNPRAVCGLLVTEKPCDCFECNNPVKMLVVFDNGQHASLCWTCIDTFEKTPIRNISHEEFIKVHIMPASYKSDKPCPTCLKDMLYIPPVFVGLSTKTYICPNCKSIWELNGSEVQK